MNRRSFLQVSTSSAAGLMLGFYLPETSKVAAEVGVPNAAARLNRLDSHRSGRHR